MQEHTSVAWPGPQRPVYLCTNAPACLCVLCVCVSMCRWWELEAFRKQDHEVHRGVGQLSLPGILAQEDKSPVSPGSCLSPVLVNITESCRRHLREDSECTRRRNCKQVRRLLWEGCSLLIQGPSE